jgi:SpoVK/Ycf46/Vps4 family AAA+-type ATPase
MNFYALKDSPFHSSVFNHFYWYCEKFNIHPNFYETRMAVMPSIIERIRELESEQIFIHNIDIKKKTENNQSEDVLEKITTPVEMIFLYKDALIIINWSSNHHYSFSDYDPVMDFSKYFIRILYQKEETVNEIKNLFEYKIEKNKKNVHLLCRTEGELITQKFEVKLPQEEMDLELNYGKELVEKTTKLVDKLNDNQSGLALFSGPPGTGKSTYIKYLSTQTNRKIIYLPSSSIEEITSPDFLTFMIDFKNSILLLEDAEKVLRSRELQENPGISNILNLSDGLLGDCLSVFIIATFNSTRDQIDKALVRKGRLTLEHEFNELPIENCNRIFEKLNLNKKAEKPMSLADIYNNEENYSKKEEKRRVGF